MATFQDSTRSRFPNSGAHAARFRECHRDQSGRNGCDAGAGYTYSTADAFDANGEWIAHADGHNEYLTDMRFTIRNNRLISLSCGTPVTMPTTLSVQTVASHLRVLTDS